MPASCAALNTHMPGRPQLSAHIKPFPSFGPCLGLPKQEGSSLLAVRSLHGDTSFPCTRPAGL